MGKYNKIAKKISKQVTKEVTKKLTKKLTKNISKIIVASLDWQKIISAENSKIESQNNINNGKNKREINHIFYDN